MNSKKSTSGTSSKKSVSAARLHQKSGVKHSFGGVAKVKHANGTFSMKRVGR